MSCVYFCTFLPSCYREKSGSRVVLALKWIRQGCGGLKSKPGWESRLCIRHIHQLLSFHLLRVLFFSVLFSSAFLALSRETKNLISLIKCAVFLLQIIVQVRDRLHLWPRKMKMWFIDSANPDCHKAKAIKLDEFSNYRFCLFWIILLQFLFYIAISLNNVEQARKNGF